jgi:predicted SnoaL-like aldol condensation-catalyzing enzyme
MKIDLEQNKKNAMAFYSMAFNDNKPAEAVEMYVGDEYIQHNPLVGDGKEAFITYFIEMATKWPGKKVSFVRAVAEDNLVVLHCHQEWPGDSDYSTMDFFRFDDNGKIVEHWDVMQVVPEASQHNNTMF